MPHLSTGRNQRSPNVPEAFTIVFRAKIQETPYTDGTLASRRIPVPTLTTKHVADMNRARQSKRFGDYANSDLFPSMVRREAEKAGCVRIGDTLRVDLLRPLPDGITVDASGFLATVTIRIPD